MEANDCINVVLGKVKHAKDVVGLNSGEYEVLYDLVTCLSDFDTATIGLSGQKYVTVSLIIPTVKSLINDLEESLNKCKTSTGKIFGEDLLNFCRRKLMIYESNKSAA